MIGSGDAKPLKEFILEMVAACGPESKPLFGDVPFTGTNMPLSTFSIDAIKNDCGFVIDVPFGKGTKMTMDWLKTIEQ
jgi:nucleoside-diphosphate-sugar epimerase